MWKTTLIIRPSDEGDPIPGSVDRVRKDFNIDDGMAISALTRIALGAQKGEIRPTLQGRSEDDVKAFFADLDDCHTVCAGQVPALCYANAGDLQAMHQSVLWLSNYKYLVAWCGDQIKHLSEPYARRFLSFGEPEMAVAKSVSEQQIGNRWTGADPGALVFLNPLRLTLDEARATLTTSDEYPGYWFLPPWRDVHHPERVESYFSENRLKIRALLRQLCGAGVSRADEPAAITIQRLVDDPALRDLFLDGGQMQFGVQDDGAMDVSLAMFTSNQLSRFRAAVARGSAGACDWIAPLAKSIAADLRSIVPGGTHGTADEPLSWAVDGDNASNSNSEGQPGAEVWTEMEGVWQDIDHILKRLEESDEQASKELNDLVLRPTARLNRRHHDFALNLYCSNFWRCPALASEAIKTAWHFAAVHLLRVDSSQYEALPKEWERVYANQLKCEQRQGRYFVSYVGHPTEELIWRWRFLFPLGTIIVPRTFCLDIGERSRLDAGYVLA